MGLFQTSLLLLSIPERLATIFQGPVTQSIFSRNLSCNDGSRSIAIARAGVLHYAMKSLRRNVSLKTNLQLQLNRSCQHKSYSFLRFAFKVGLFFGRHFWKERKQAGGGSACVVDRYCRTIARQAARGVLHYAEPKNYCILFQKFQLAWFNFSCNDFYRRMVCYTSCKLHEKLHRVTGPSLEGLFQTEVQRVKCPLYNNEYNMTVTKEQYWKKKYFFHKIHTWCLSIENKIEARWNLQSGFFGSIFMPLLMVTNAASDFFIACCDWKKK